MGTIDLRNITRDGGSDSSAALFRYSGNRSGGHPVEHLRGFAGILQVDADAGYRQLYELGRSPGPVTEALFDIEREINGEPTERRLAVRRELSAPLVAEFEAWMRSERASHRSGSRRPKR